MINIRANVFETNSSSVHSLTFVDEPKYTKWAKGELYYNRFHADAADDDPFIENQFVKAPEFVTYEEAKALDKHFPYPEESNYWYGYDFEFKDEETGHYIERVFITLDDFMKYSSFDTFDEQHTTPSGDIVHAVGYYGHD